MIRMLGAPLRSGSGSASSIMAAPIGRADGRTDDEADGDPRRALPGRADPAVVGEEVEQKQECEEGADRG